MTRNIAYPSADFPGPPTITVGIPDDWETLTVPGVHLAAAQPHVDGQFRANIVVTVQRFGPDFTDQDARAGLEQRKSSLPGLEELGTGTVDVDGTSWTTSEYSYTQPGHTTVVQSARYTLVDRGGVAKDIVEIVGSCGAESAGDEAEIVRSIQDTVTVELA
ncbi:MULTISPECIES: hypothetical protein [Brachybacterium]|uniref:Lipoprotein LpqN n=1 Tax=Brachybacterium alimentarium TaxID=47845 RepID=A0A2A3YIM4_9MICO|nr:MULTISPECIES: hypothetical protein [Brachybacterium]PCC35618.1 hypothetical protein CIK71_01375 [Brachybacterium alimentarium]PCC39144.1 hypothetical protein CIK66_09665 [Brachybacterium alimentarium]RCS64686.1 hypothetical protein CIK81_08760 [Brachybacterium sp. JB7]RCS66599.1 hypothetical protein CIK73_12380 [Brachybacterium alimentarium]RCS68000.1 hypothetical protein CIK68_14165 [Brachybacterium alimentarium]